MEDEVKEPAPKYNYISPDEYLEMERASEKRHEYHDGQIFAMSGASLRHNRIERNILRDIGNFLEQSECEVLPSHMRVSTPSRDSDMIIVCGKPELEDDKFDTLINPAVIIEILSPSTKNIDKERKFFFYKEIPTLREYIMIDSVKKSFIIVRRQSDNSWEFQNMTEKDSELFIQTIGYRLALSKIYNGTGL